MKTILSGSWLSRIGLGPPVGSRLTTDPGIGWSGAGCSETFQGKGLGRCRTPSCDWARAQAAAGRPRMIVLLPLIERASSTTCSSSAHLTQECNT